MAITAYAQNSLLFEISGNGMKGKSYLFGTMHVQDEEAFGWNDSVFYAIDAAEDAVFELDMRSVNIKKQMKPSMKQLNAWKTYAEKEIAPEVEKRISADSLADRVVRLYASFMSEAMDKSKDSRGTFVDKFLQEYATKQEKEIVGIESFSDQLDVFLQTDKDQVKQGIIDFLDKDDWDIDVDMMLGATDQLSEAYQSKDLTQVCKYLNATVQSSSNQMINDLYQRIFQDRNEVMTKKTLKMLKNKQVFIAVGAGHLCGESGLVEQYKKAGYTVRPVDIKSPVHRALTWKAFDNEEFAVEVPEGVDEFYQNMEDFDFASMLAENTAATIYTGMGKAEFSIEKVVDWNEYEYDEASEYNYDYPVEEVMDEVAEEAVAEVEYLGDAESDAVEVETEVVEVEEVEEVYEADEVPPAVEDAPPTEEILIDTDDDEPFDKPNPFAFSQEEPSTEGMEYWDIVKTKVMAGVMKSLMGGMIKTSDLIEAGKEGKVEEEKLDSTEVTIMGETHYMVDEEELFTGGVRKVMVSKNGVTYNLKISGDDKVIKSPEVVRFFESFYIKE